MKKMSDILSNTIVSNLKKSVNKTKTCYHHTFNHFVKTQTLKVNILNI